MSQVILASASPRRRDILNMLGLPHQVIPSSIQEENIEGESPAKRVSRLAFEKAADVFKSCDDDSLVIGADTLVACNGHIMGQPGNKEEAAKMLRILSGNSHSVLTGLCLMRKNLPSVEDVAKSRVFFHKMTEEEIDWYISTGEPMDKAGAYAVQGTGSIFIEKIEGSYHNVVGFPVDIFYQLLSSMGLSLEDIRRA